jgi:hypothetical protein
MLVATFGPTTAWAGKKINREGDFFILEDHGPLTADDVMAYDRQELLVWANDGTRAWVGSKVGSEPTSAISSSTAPAVDRRPSPDAGVADSPFASLKKAVSEHLLLLIVAVAAVVIVGVVLAVSGVFEGEEQPAGNSAQPIGAQASTVATPLAEDASWPTKLAGTWVGTSGGSLSRIVISESGGQATITMVASDGRILYWVFSGETLTGTDENPQTVDAGPFGRVGASSQPYTGTYVWTATGSYSQPTVTMQVGFDGSTLGMNQTNSGSLPGLTASYRYALSPDGQTLSVGSEVFARQ